MKDKLRGDDYKLQNSRGQHKLDNKPTCSKFNRTGEEDKRMKDKDSPRQKQIVSPKFKDNKLLNKPNGKDFKMKEFAWRTIALHPLQDAKKEDAILCDEDKINI